MSETDTVEKSWSRITEWLGRKAKRVRKKLVAGASEEEIARAEQALGLSLPEDLRASYRIHNGAEDSGLFPASGLDENGYSPLSLAEVLEERHESSPASDKYVTADEAVQARHWHPHWLPFASNGGGDYLCVDLAPAPGGTPGQVIEWLHETSERKRVAPSLGDYLRDLAEGLEAGRYKYDSESGVHRPAPPAREETPAEKLADLERHIRSADLGRIGPNRPTGPGTEPEWQIFTLFDRIDPDRRYFGPACDDHLYVIGRMLPSGHTERLFYDHFAPRQRVAVNGYVLFTIAEIFEATRPHFLKHRNVVVFGLTPGGDRLYFDAWKYDDNGLKPVMTLPAEVNLARASGKKLQEASVRVARNVVRFFEERVLAGGEARVTPA
jgi:cell wall assembly regulator SMI1